MTRGHRREVLGFYGTDRGAAWAMVFRLAETIVETQCQRTMSVRAEKVKGEWVVVLYRAT